MSVVQCRPLLKLRCTTCVKSDEMTCCFLDVCDDSNFLSTFKDKDFPAPHLSRHPFKHVQLQEHLLLWDCTRLQGNSIRFTELYLSKVLRVIILFLFDVKITLIRHTHISKETSSDMSELLFYFMSPLMASFYLTYVSIETVQEFILVLLMTK